MTTRMRAIQTYCDLIAGAVLDGIQAEMTRSGVDIGESAEAPVEDVPAARPSRGLSDVAEMLGPEPEGRRPPAA